MADAENRAPPTGKNREPGNRAPKQASNHTGLPTVIPGVVGEEASVSNGRSWGRFRQVRLLGRGGMGEVYEADDPHLQRRVAVKLLRDERPVAVQRFIREARAQARVEHELICPIYEVGEADGKPYIVMQLIRGRPLDQAAAEMNLEQQLVTMVRIAGAVHEAHRAGLIHRDLKPSNILVEESEDGDLKPYVMDFGIARSHADPGMTTEGSFLGTPAFSAPEQVRGDTAAIDRRSDVYALGATLYTLLSGAPPFQGPTPTVLLEVLQSIPRPLRPFGIPGEVETIVLKCLDKDPARRYGSARALAEDLQRFLDGEPILARPVGLAIRLLKRARKHRALVAVITIALLLIAAALTWGGYTRWRARARERLVAELTALVAGIEAEVRYSQLSPRHDTRSDWTRLRHDMAAIRTRIDAAGAIAEGPGSYALGRGYLVLDDMVRARHHLETAWQAGYRQPQVAHALGLTLSLLFRQALAEVEIISDSELRSQRQQELQQEYQRPAVAFMRQSQGLDPQADRYLRALLAFHQNQLDEALQILGSSETRYPWFHEAHKLEGDIYRQQALQRQDAGDTEAARRSFERALLAYRQAQEIAESDVSIPLAAGHTQLLLMTMDEFTESDPLPHYQTGLDEVHRALATSPEDDRAFLLEARLHYRKAERHRHRHEDPVADLELALTAARRAIEHSAKSSQAWKLAGRIHSSSALWFREQGNLAEQRAAIDRSIDALGRVAQSWQDFSYFNALGVAYFSLADVQARQGGDAGAHYQRALSAYRRAISLHPNPPYPVLNNLYVSLFRLSSQPGVVDPIQLLREAAAVMEQALRRHADNPVPYYNLGRCYLRLAQGGDPASEILGPQADKALEYYRQGQRLNPQLPHFYSGIGEVLYLKAQQEWDHGRDAEALFSEAERVYQQGIDRNPSFSYLRLNLAWTYYYRGKYCVREGKSPGVFLERAIQEARLLLETSPSDSAALCLGGSHRLLAEHEMLNGRSPLGNIAQAQAALDQIIARNPEYVLAHRSLGRLATLEARWRVRVGDDPTEAFGRAYESLARALELGPGIPAVHLAEVRRCLHQAVWEAGRGRVVAELLSRGQVHANRALAIREGWAEALAAKSCLHLLAQRDDDNPESRGQAEADLHQALLKNPHLRTEWGSCSSLASAG